MTAAMGVSRDLRAALKAVEKMEASLLRDSYAVASVDDAGLRDDLLATTEEARRGHHRKDEAQNLIGRTSPRQAPLTKSAIACRSMGTPTYARSVATA